ncbi:kinesin family member 6 [Pelomyxa schiedti]|nr:kinesin family member 6 [Pelomyxa schiedti]
MDPIHQTIFDCVAKKLVLTALEGYNATLFAYGQTGSGKTFTITGGTKHYSLRGIIPRALELIFHETSRRTELDWRVQVSYMEIYNEIAYDLLDPNHEADSMEELPRVSDLPQL